MSFKLKQKTKKEENLFYRIKVNLFETNEKKKKNKTDIKGLNLNLIIWIIFSQKKKNYLFFMF